MPTGENWIYRCFIFHSKQHKTCQENIGTQEPTPIGSKASLGPSMDHTGPIIGPYNSLNFYRVSLNLPNTFSGPVNQLVTTLWISWYSNMKQGALVDLHGHQNVPWNRPFVADFGGPLPIKGPKLSGQVGSFWSGLVWSGRFLQEIISLCDATYMLGLSRTQVKLEFPVRLKCGKSLDLSTI